jgi:hypothetical protein
VDGLLYDKSRPPGIPPIAFHRVEEIITLALKAEMQTILAPGQSIPL